MTIMTTKNASRLPAVVEAAPSREVWTIEDLQKIAQNVAASAMFGLNQAQAFTLMLLCEAEGLHPIQAVRRYHIIQGRPTMRADAMLAEMQRRGWDVEWANYSLDGQKATASFAHPKQPGASVTYTMEDARKAGLVKDGSGWTKHPAAMLRARVISTACRMLDPGIIVGIYTPEEAEEDVRQEERVSRAEALEQRLQAATEPMKGIDVTPIPEQPVSPPAKAPEVPDPEWRLWLADQCQRANDAIANDCKIEAVEVIKCVAPEQVGQHLVNEEITAGRLNPDVVFGKGGKRTNAKVRDIVAAIYEASPEDFRRRVIAYIGEQIDVATKRIAALASQGELPIE